MNNEKIDELTQKLEEGLKGMLNSDSYKAWLKCVSSFYNYSFANTILISMQGREIEGFEGMIASYTKWKSMGRTVKKGEKGIRIFAPAPIKRKAESINEKTGETEEKEIVINAFKAVSVFDLSQTEGKELPKTVNELKLSVNNYEEVKKALTDISPVPIEFMEIRSGAKRHREQG